MGLLMASLQILYQCRFLWYIGEAGVPWVGVGLVLGSACLANLAAYFLGIRSAGGRFGLTIGTALVSAIVPLLGATCIALAGGLMRPWWCVWEVGRCLF